MENKNKIIREILEKEKEHINKYQLTKKGISAKTLDNWSNDRTKVNTVVIDFILAVTDNDEKRLEYLKMFETESGENNDN